MATPTERLENWDEFEIGAVLKSFDENGNYSRDHSKTYVEKPIFNRDLCIDCDMCWVACPDSCFQVEEVTNKRGKKQANIVGIDYDHCKGCAICVEVCPTPVKSLLMFPEFEDDNEALANWPKKEKKDK